MQSHRHPLLRLPLPLLLLLISHHHAAAKPLFSDRTAKSGIDRTMGKTFKYGGPTVADFDGDGNYDLVFIYHGSHPMQVYFGTGKGYFIKNRFERFNDNHATVPFRLPGVKEAFFALSPGGGAGTTPSFPNIFQVTADRKVTEVTDQVGLDAKSGRGRSTVVFPFRKGASPDLLVLNTDSTPDVCQNCQDGQLYAYRYTGKPVAAKANTYVPQKVAGLNDLFNVGGRKLRYVNSWGMAIDPDGDSQMELLMWKNLTLHRLTGSFQMQDVSTSVLGSAAYLQNVAAVAEIDFDNDGDFDLYIAREATGWHKSKTGVPRDDVFLENRGGKYYDISDKVNIPKGTISRGVTVADFNNDGYADIYLTVYDARDRMLFNNGDGTFRDAKNIVPRKWAAGDNAVAVDYDGDGHVDLIRGEGEIGFEQKFLGKGFFRILHNEMRRGNHVTVRVGSSPAGATSLYAVVMVNTGSAKLMRRVASGGVQGAKSYLDTVHVGIGSAKKVIVVVKWADGTSKRLAGVKAGSKVSIGGV